MQARKTNTVGRLILSELAPVVAAARYLYILDSSQPARSWPCWPAMPPGRGVHGKRLTWAKALVGQCAADQQKILLANVPPGYARISSGLGDAPRNILILPIVFEATSRACWSWRRSRARARPTRRSSSSSPRASAS
jgi:hypothetical protein